MLNKRELLLASTALLTLTVAAKSQPAFSIFQAAKPSPQFAALAVGAGGAVTGLDIHSDGTMLVRTDVGGAYKNSANNLGLWQQLVTATSLPAASGTTILVNNGQPLQGVWEIRSAPSNSSILYMVYAGQFFKSTDQGQTWTAPSATGLTLYPGGTSAWRGATPENNHPSSNYGQKIAVDPNNANCVIVGTPQSGIFYTTDGGSTFTALSSVPTVGTATGYAIAFDPASGTVGGLTKNIYVTAVGSGVWATTGGATASFTQVSSTITLATAIIVRNGTVYIVGGTGTNTKLFSYTGGTAGTFTTLLTDTNTLWAVDVDPGNASHIAVQDGNSGGVWVSFDGGATWGTQHAANNFNYSATGDITWLASTNVNFLGFGGCAFDGNNKFWCTNGIGIAWVSNSSGFLTTGTGTITFNFKSAGIEELVGCRVISPPFSGSKPIVCAEDRSEFRISNPTVYPSSYSTEALVTNTCAGWDVDFDKVAGTTIIGLNNSQAPDTWTASSDGGQTWSALGAFPPTGNQNGSIAVSTSTNWIAIKRSTNAIYFTTNAGASWTQSTGITGTWPSQIFNHYSVLAADGSTANVFYGIDSAGEVFKSTNSGSSFTKVGTITSPGSYNTPQLRSVPGQAGHLLYTAGQQSAPFPSGTSAFFSSNGGAAWTAIANVQDVWAIGTGAIYPGDTYPTIWLDGWVSLDGGVTYNYGIWVGRNFNTSTTAATWTRLTQFPNNSLDLLNSICGDGNDYTKCYFALQGTGFGYGENLQY